MKTSIDDLKRKRFFKVKRATNHFICPLCSAPRETRYNKNLKESQYIQMTVLSASLIWLLFPYMGLKSLFLIFVVWLGFELVNKMLYRREIPCPYCGFDATWYRRDVRIARKKVEEFWKEKGTDNTVQNILNQQKEKNSSTPTHSDQQTPEVDPAVFSQENADNVLKDNMTNNM